jgi:hypothetical protein
MAYSRKARELRQCTAIRADGEPCSAWARWGCADRLCTAHAIRRRGKRDDYSVIRSKAKCTCEAYDWPHRPGSGFCRWPDPPDEICDTPAGTRSGPRWARNKWGKGYGRVYAEMMESALGDNIQGTATREKRGRPRKDSASALLSVSMRFKFG